LIASIISFVNFETEFFRCFLFVYDWWTPNRYLCYLLCRPSHHLCDYCLCFSIQWSYCILFIGDSVSSRETFPG